MENKCKILAYKGNEKIEKVFEKQDDAFREVSRLREQGYVANIYDDNLEDKVFEKEELARIKGKHTCTNCYQHYTEYGMSNCKKHDMPLEDEDNECCDDWC